MRAATMSRMSPVDISPALSESDNLARKVMLLLLLIVVSTLWIAFLFQQQTGIPLLLSTFFADATIGLTAGFGSRVALSKKNLYIRSLVAILLTFFGMLLLGFFTRWVLGIGPIMLDSKVLDQIQKLTLQRNLLDQISTLKINWSTLFDLRKLDWADPVHLALSMLMAGLALDAWTTSPSSSSTPEPVELASLPPTPVATPARRMTRTTSTASNGRARIHLPVNWFPGLRPSPTPQRRRRSNGQSQPSVQPEAKIMKEPVVHPKRRRSRRKPKIQFALVEEHRCPYCLDTVTRNDPRGVQECEVCHTLHHADCWAITGICQVPHLNT